MSLPEIIDGWFCVAFSHELRPGRVHSLEFMGNPLYLMRTESGRVAAVDHPFLTSAVTSTSSDQTARSGEHPEPGLRRWHVHEQRHKGLGAIWLWHHHQGIAPTWHLPTWDEEGWGRAFPATFRIRGNTQDVIENGVDLGHFECIHGVVDVDPGALSIEGPLMHFSLTVTSEARMLLRKAEDVRARLGLQLYGLGLSFADTFVSSIGARMRSFVAPRPLGNGEVEIRCWIVLEEPGEVASQLPMVGRFLPRRLGERLMERIMHRVFVEDFSRDLRYLDGRRYLGRPALGRKDVFIGTFRKWARQFYPAHLLASGRQSTQAA